MSLVSKLIIAVAALYALLWIGSIYLQRRLMYFPDPERVPPAQAGLPNVEEVAIPSGDGHTLIAWWGKAQAGQPTLLYFHGNAGALADRADRIARYLGRGIGVMIMAYRGYGGSTGQPSERNNVSDAKSAYDWLVAHGVKPGDIVLYGESLGSGVAVQVAAEKPVAGLILDAPYTSLVDVANIHYPHLPARHFMTDRYETVKHLPAVTAPLLVVHGTHDRVIPITMGERIYREARGPKEIKAIRGAGHSDHASFGSLEAVLAWLTALKGRTSERPAAQ